jgi:hypothetical protein
MAMGRKESYISDGVLAFWNAYIAHGIGMDWNEMG